MSRGGGWWHGAADTLADSIPMGDFGLWNELRARGHEVMPHGYRHANKRKMPFADAKELILRCLDVFDRELTASWCFKAAAPPAILRAFRPESPFD
jgi:peptidoglycan/xylan/chitin deacetylase (PgdA/CDA1 family)